MHKENENHKKGRNTLNISMFTVTVLCLILVSKGLVLNHLIKLSFIHSRLETYLCVNDIFHRKIFQFVKK